ncbi:MAG: GAF domain-containing protein [Psychrilyobacter sp.]|uniref:GAF domain-containing protein n=1 Tax=Psychrilyobacter sp. TaxID=2586924 RepID=UPI003C76526F
MTNNPVKSYTYLLNLAKNLTENEDDFIANCANLSSLIFNNIEDLNWAGFYLWKNDKLILGPFQGLTATTKIELGKGVCGSSAKDKITYVVPDVHKFPGHIACDLASNSEIVIPLIKDQKLIGVLDIDSPKLNRFSEDDKINLEKLVFILLENSCL